MEKLAEEVLRGDTGESRKLRDKQIVKFALAHI